MLQIVVVASLLLLVYWRTIRGSMVNRWLNEPAWSHGWLIPAFSLYFLATHRERLMRARAAPSYVGAGILAISLIVFFVSSGWMLRFAYPQAVSLVGAIFGVTLLLGGWGILRVAWFPILFLLLAVPLPQGLYVALTLPLRAFASSVAAAAMPLLTPGLYTEAQAVVIDFIMPGSPPGQLNVEEACSGMRLLMAFVTLGVAMAWLHDRPNWQRAVMVASCIPIAIFCNAIRVTVTGLLYVHGREDLATGVPHQALGILMMLLAMALYALLGYVLTHLFVDDTGKTPEPA